MLSTMVTLTTENNVFIMTRKSILMVRHVRANLKIRNKRNYNMHEQYIHVLVYRL